MGWKLELFLSTIPFLFTLALAIRSEENTKGLSCSSHPLYKPGFQGELIRSWSYVQFKEKLFYFSDSGYIPRYRQHAWAPYDQPNSTKYADLDFFVSYQQKKVPRHYLTLHFHRPAKVYIFVGGYLRNRPVVRLPGWISEGWAVMVRGDASKKAQIGLVSKKEFSVSKHSYVFSKPANIDVELPSMMWVKQNIQGMKTNGYYFVLAGEKDGSSVRPPTAPEGMRITAGKHCPMELHDEWVVPGFDKQDKQTAKRYFKTWHPLWDPCFWCSYPHEHGSSSKELMGYAPRYGYAALKNNNEDESHGGFKDYVLDLGAHRLYYSLHAHLSLPRRFFTRHHTVVLVLSDVKTKEVLAHFNYKADFGFAATKRALPKGGMLPLTEKDTRLMEAQRAGTETKGFREVNILDPKDYPKNLDKRILYRVKGKKVYKGEYERWMAYPLCSSRNIRGPVADFKGAQNALRTTSSTGNDTTTLGRWLHGIFRQNNAVNRDLRFVGWEIGTEHCDMMNGSLPSNGVFYTDPYGKKLVDGPAPNAMRQFIKPGFKLRLPDGIYMVDDTWLGLFKEGYLGGMVDIMNAVDPTKN